MIDWNNNVLDEDGAENMSVENHINEEQNYMSISKSTRKRKTNSQTQTWKSMFRFTFQNRTGKSGEQFVLS